jgi:hypothetical protein
MSHEFRPGEVISYPYLWAWQQQRGETEGRKLGRSASSSPSAAPPTEIAIWRFSPSPGSRPRRAALEIPDIERKRAGLSDLKQCWIMIDEYNYDIVERSWYIEPDQRILGRFSKSFMIKIAQLFADTRGRTSRVNRLD